MIKKTIFISFLLLLMVSFVSAWSTNQFNDSSTSGSITITADTNYTRWLSIPEDTYLTRGSIFLAASTTLSNNLQRYYKLDETSGTVAVDETLNQNGTADAGVLTSVNGIINSGGQFDGVSRILFAYHSWVGNSDEISISLWANFSNIGAGRDTLIAMSNSVATITPFVLDRTSSTVFRWRVQFNDSSVTTLVINPQVWFQNNEIYHIVAVVNDTSLNLYVNGTLANSTARTSSQNLVKNTGTAIAIGGYGVLDAYHMTGVLDEVGLWNRSLSQEEVTKLYNSSSGYSFDGFQSTALLGEINFKIYLSENLTYSNNTFTNKTINNFTSILNSYHIPSCTPVSGNCLIPMIFQSNSSVILDYSQINFSNNGFMLNSVNYNTSSYETKEETFSFDIYYDENRYTLPTVYLNYNGTNYTTTKSGSNNNYIFTYTMDIPSEAVGNTSFFWIFKSGSERYDSITYYQNVSAINFTLCTPDINTVFLNLTFKDETTLSFINASIPYLNFTYYLGSGDVTKYYTYATTNLNYNYSFCFSPALETVNSLINLQYKQGTTYPQRIWSPEVQTYTNTTTDETLFLLGTSTGGYVTFQVVNPAGQTVEGVTVVGTRLIDGTSTQVANGVTDSAGAVQFFLDGTFQHTFTFTKSGYSTETITIYPTETSYTVTLGLSSTSTVSDFTRGITIRVLPTADTYFYNGTVYNVNMTISSTYWSLDNFGYSVKLSNGTVLDTETSSSDTGGTLSSLINTSNHSVIIMTYYYTVNGTTLTFTTQWAVLNSNWDDWSIKTFFTDFSAYLESGLFGLDDFGVNLIVFLILFLSIGVASYKYGFTSPVAVTTMLFAIIYFFDVAVDILPEINAIPNFLTFIAGLIVVGTVIRETTR